MIHAKCPSAQLIANVRFSSSRCSNSNMHIRIAWLMTDVRAWVSRMASSLMSAMQHCICMSKAGSIATQEQGGSCVAAEQLLLVHSAAQRPMQSGHSRKLHTQLGLYQGLQVAVDSDTLKKIIAQFACSPICIASSGQKSNSAPCATLPNPHAPSKGQQQPVSKQMPCAAFILRKIQCNQHGRVVMCSLHTVLTTIAVGGGRPASNCLD